MPSGAEARPGTTWIWRTQQGPQSHDWKEEDYGQFIKSKMQHFSLIEEKKRTVGLLNFSC